VFSDNTDDNSTLLEAASTKTVLGIVASICASEMKALRTSSQRRFESVSDPKLRLESTENGVAVSCKSVSKVTNYQNVFSHDQHF
jgi:hypothetical protein